VTQAIEQLREMVCTANRRLASSGLVTLTWGNVSAIDADRNLVAIKPSGVAYDELRPEQIVVVNLEGVVQSGDLRPSSDTPTHVYLYRHFQNVGAIVHTHSRYATMFAQARREIPCLGTTHADHFRGAVPVTRPLSVGEAAEGYETNTGKVIAERFATLDPDHTPAVLAAGHAPFTWGKNDKSPQRSDNAIALEAVAEMTLGTVRQLAPERTASGRPRIQETYITSGNTARMPITVKQPRAPDRQPGPCAGHGRLRSTVTHEVRLDNSELWFVTGSQQLYGERRARPSRPAIQRPSQRTSERRGRAACACGGQAGVDGPGKDHIAVSECHRR
jgi:L-ribulose-5-phosphate 4-epimerase